MIGKGDDDYLSSHSDSFDDEFCKLELEHEDDGGSDRLQIDTVRNAEFPGYTYLFRSPKVACQMSSTKKKFAPSFNLNSKMMLLVCSCYLKPSYK